MTATVAEKDLEVDRALCRSFVAESLAIAMRLPTPDQIHSLGAGGLLLGASRVLGLEDAVQRILSAAKEAVLSDLTAEHQRLFGHTARGKVPPYETEYGAGDPFRQAEDLADIGGFYRVFGLKVSDQRRERVDHIGAELEFLSFLASKEAYELMRGEEAGRDDVRKAERIFLDDHLNHFGRAFARGLKEGASQLFYISVANLLALFLLEECAELGVSPGPEFVALSSDVEANVPMACGSCSLHEREPTDEE